MPTPIKLIGRCPQMNKHRGFTSGVTLTVGDAWFATLMNGRWYIYDHDEPGLDMFIDLAPGFESQNRKPLCVVLPGRVAFCVDSATVINGEPQKGGWHVSGPPEKITVHPSINLKGYFHGWIKDGIISDRI